MRLAGSIVTLKRLLRVLAGEGLLGAFGKTYLAAYFAQKRALGRDALPMPDFVSTASGSGIITVANDGQVSGEGPAIAAPSRRDRPGSSRQPSDWTFAGGGKTTLLSFASARCLDDPFEAAGAKRPAPASGISTDRSKSPFVERRV